MDAIRKWFRSLVDNYFWTDDLGLDPRQMVLAVLIAALWVAVASILVYSSLHAQAAYAADSGTVSLPGSDMSSSLSAAGILLKTLDTGIFKWGARLFAGLCIMSSAWALKEQRFGIAIICIIGAILFGTAPKWVSDIFTMGGNAGIFGNTTSQVDSISPGPRCSAKETDLYA